MGNRNPGHFRKEGRVARTNGLARGDNPYLPERKPNDWPVWRLQRQTYWDEGWLEEDRAIDEANSAEVKRGDERRAQFGGEEFSDLVLAVVRAEREYERSPSVHHIEVLSAACTALDEAVETLRK